MFTAASLFVLTTMALALLRAVRGPSVYDRIVAVNAFGTMTVLLLVLLGFLTDRPEFEDIALLYGLINFAGTIAVLKFVKYSSLAGTGAKPTAGAADGHDPEPAQAGPVSWSPGGLLPVSGIGMVRMPDVFTRMHAASLGDTLGAGLIIVGLLFQAGLAADLVGIKLVLILVFLLFTGPVASHALAQAAFWTA